jgi:hypothetical protein
MVIITQHLPLQDPPKFSQFGLFGMKIHMPSGNPESGKRFAAQGSTFDGGSKNFQSENE